MRLIPFPLPVRSDDGDTGCSLAGYWVKLVGWSGVRDLKNQVKVNHKNWDSFEPVVTFLVTN